MFMSTRQDLGTINSVLEAGKVWFSFAARLVPAEVAKVF